MRDPGHNPAADVPIQGLLVGVEGPKGSPLNRDSSHSRVRTSFYGQGYLGRDQEVTPVTPVTTGFTRPAPDHSLRVEGRGPERGPKLRLRSQSGSRVLLRP